MHLNDRVDDCGRRNSREGGAQVGNGGAGASRVSIIVRGYGHTHCHQVGECSPKSGAAAADGGCLRGVDIQVIRPGDVVKTVINTEYAAVAMELHPGARRIRGRVGANLQPVGTAALRGPELIYTKDVHPAHPVRGGRGRLGLHIRDERVTALRAFRRVGPINHQLDFGPGIRAREALDLHDRIPGGPASPGVIEMEVGSITPDVIPAAEDGECAVTVVGNGPFQGGVADIGADPVDLGVGAGGPKGPHAKREGGTGRSPSLGAGFENSGRGD